jgi:hypothetical protein
MDHKKIFGRFEDQKTFIKTVKKPVVDGAAKAALNRKGNLLFNSGDIESSRRIFLTTGYSDGLSRVGDAYLSRGMYLDALRMYWMAAEKTKAEPVIMRLAALLRDIIHEEDEEDVDE